MATLPNLTTEADRSAKDAPAGISILKKNPISPSAQQKMVVSVLTTKPFSTPRTTNMIYNTNTTTNSNAAPIVVSATNTSVSKICATTLSGPTLDSNKATNSFTKFQSTPALVGADIRSFKLSTTAPSPQDIKMGLHSKDISQILAKQRGFLPANSLRVPNPYAVSTQQNVIVNSNVVPAPATMTVRIPASTIITTNKANVSKHSLLLPPSFKTTVSSGHSAPTTSSAAAITAAQSVSQITPLTPQSTTTNLGQQKIIITNNKSTLGTIQSPIPMDDFFKTVSHDRMNMTTNQPSFRCVTSSNTQLVQISNSTTNSTISVQISNGRLSDPNGPIKLLSSARNTSGCVVTASETTKLDINRENTIVKVGTAESAAIDSSMVKQPQHSLTKMTISNNKLIMNKLSRPQNLALDRNFRRLLSSPRLHKRSKSFTAKFQQSVTRVRRIKRLSESRLEGDEVEAYDTDSTNKLKLQCDDDQGNEKTIEDIIHSTRIEKIPKEIESSAQRKKLIITGKSHIPTNEFNVLLCDEKLENSSENTTSSCDSLSKSKTPPKIESIETIGSKALQSDVIYRPIVANPVKIIKKIIEQNRLGSDESGYQVESRLIKQQICLKDTFRRVVKMRPKLLSTLSGSSINDEQLINDPANLIQWSDGIGFLKESRLHFQFNEFGLIEILDDDEYQRLKGGATINKLYEIPLEKRPIDQLVPSIKKEVLETDSDRQMYHCTGCGVAGLAHDFIAPEFCSISCFKNVKTVKGVLDTKENSQSSSILQRALGYTGESETIQFDDNRTQLTASEMSEESIDDAEFRPRTESDASLPIFNWDAYLHDTQGIAAPPNLFINPFPSSPNGFAVGMKLEAIDPENASMFCVCSVVEIRGFRMRLHFDGFSSIYDFWVNADSIDIFPPGWCRRGCRVLSVPPAEVSVSFDWSDYTKRKNCIPAPRHLFTHLNSSALHKNPFIRGMKLEADDVKNSGRICVATVMDVLENRILVHFDGWDRKYDYWADISSPNIHPIDWHKKNNFDLVPPPDSISHNFTWQKYLTLTMSRAAPEILFCTRKPFKFQPGMKLEVVDRKNPALIRPATIVETNGYELKVLFDGWPSIYAFWMEDDSVDIHPVNWSLKTNHLIEFPPGYGYIDSTNRCGIIGCRGISNTKHVTQNSHNCLDECPYEIKNWTKTSRKMDRLKSKPILHKSYRPTLRAPSESSNSGDSPPLIRKRVHQLQPYEGNIVEIPDHPDQKRIRRISNADFELDGDRKDFVLNIEEPEKTINETARRLAVSKEYLGDYGPRLVEAHDLWTANSKMFDIIYDENRGLLAKNPVEWSVEEVVTYISKLPSCAEAAVKFEEESVDGAALLCLTQDDLIKFFEVKLGPAIKIYNRIIALREHINVHFLEK